VGLHFLSHGFDELRLVRLLQHIFECVGVILIGNGSIAEMVHVVLKIFNGQCLLRASMEAFYEGA
jgi:hypothetical protein